LAGKMVSRQYTASFGTVSLTKKLKMNSQSIKDLLLKVQIGHISIDEAFHHLKNYPYENIGDVVRLDHQRALRCGFPEVVFGTGKTEDQLISISERILSQENDLIITRIDQSMANRLLLKFPQLVYHPIPKMLIWKSNPKPKIGCLLVLSAGTADVPVAEEAALTAEMMGSEVIRLLDVGVAGLHRLLDKIDLLQKANVLVVVAGMEGALPSVVAGLVSAPVIAVPTSVGYGASFNGLAALLAMLNSCANGVSVVNIDNGFGAGYQAALINRQSVKTTE